MGGQGGGSVRLVSLSGDRETNSGTLLPPDSPPQPVTPAHHTQSGPFLQLNQTCPEVCLLSDTKHRHDDNEDYHRVGGGMLRKKNSP